MNIPVLALANADSPLGGTDVVIPCNNRGKKSIALVYWMLAKEVQHLRGNLSRDEEWSVMVDLFMFRDIQDDKKADEEEAAEEADEVEGTGVADAIKGEEEADGDDENADEDAAWNNKDAKDAYAGK
jgi:small subunit ribosomal protein SAe